MRMCGSWMSGDRCFWEFCLTGRDEVEIVYRGACLHMSSQQKDSAEAKDHPDPPTLHNLGRRVVVIVVGLVVLVPFKARLHLSFKGLSRYCLSAEGRLSSERLGWFLRLNNGREGS